MAYPGKSSTAPNIERPSKNSPASYPRNAKSPCPPEVRRALTEEQHAIAKDIFDDFRERDLKPAYLADADENRALLDSRVVRALTVLRRAHPALQMDYAWTWMRIDGQQDISPVIFGSDDATPLLGVMTLELFALGIDPVSQRLIQVDALA